MEINWSQFKTLISQQHGQIKCLDLGDNYLAVYVENVLQISCLVAKSSDEGIELENDYLPLWNLPLKSQVSTQLERDDIVLKLTKIKGQADSNGDLVLYIDVPGDPGVASRYAAGGYAYTDSYSWEDTITKVEIIDVLDIFGYGENTVLKQYHDSEVPEENQGWYFEKSYGSEGNVDIEPMGWYGEMRGQLRLSLTFKVSPNAKIKALIWWGKKE